MPCPFTQLEPMCDEESTEVDELSAFASLLSGPSSDRESVDAVEAQSSEAEAPTSLSMRQISDEDVEQMSEADRSSMVCRHWKSKGWCRLESNCKFLHPEHKRGVNAPKACNGSSAKSGDISGTVCPTMSTTLGQLQMISTEGELYSAPSTRRKRRGGKNRSNRNQQEQVGSPDQDVTGMHAILYSDEYPPLGSV